LLISTSPIKDKRKVIVGAVETFQPLGVASSGQQAALPISGEVKIIGQSSSMKKLLDMLPAVSASEATVVLEGESGTGKDLFAQAIHLRSPRAAAPFVAFNCSALVETLIESELFGRVISIGYAFSCSRPFTIRPHSCPHRIHRNQKNEQPCVCAAWAERPTLFYPLCGHGQGPPRASLQPSQCRGQILFPFPRNPMTLNIHCDGDGTMPQMLMYIGGAVMVRQEHSGVCMPEIVEIANPEPGAHASPPHGPLDHALGYPWKEVGAL
jgi:Sigma-54 interaction domain